MKRGTLQPTQARPERMPSELARMGRPLVAALRFLLGRYHWIIVVLAILYGLSGVTFVAPGEVALLLRNGALVGETEAQRVHRPGLLVALPPPIDEVVRVNVMQVRTLRIFELTYTSGGGGTRSFVRGDTIDPEREGYCLTADRNILQTLVVVRYRVADPIAWALGQVEPQAVLRDAVTSALGQATGERTIDDLLIGEGRGEMTRAVLESAAAEAQARGLGVELLAVELEELHPPRQVNSAFSDVIDAAIQAFTALQEAKQYAQTELPGARAEAERIRANASGEAATRVALARGEADAFRALLEELEEDGGLGRERLYRETLERVLPRVMLRVLPPPPDGGGYRDLRIEVPL